MAVTVIDQLDAVGDWGLLATDADLVVTGWNRWLELRSGLAAGDVVGRPLFDAFPDMAARRLERYYRQALAGQTVLLSQRLHRYVVPLPAAGGGPDRMPQTARIVPLLDGTAVRGTLTVIEDVTERAAHEAELATRARRQTALAAVARLALAGTDVTSLARAVVLDVADALRTDFAEILELGPDGRAWTPLAARGWADPPEPAIATTAAPRTLAALQSENAVAVEDAAADPHLGADARLRSHAVASGLVVRVPGRGQRPFGLLGVYFRARRRFPLDEVQFVQALANVLGVAAERRLLEEELRQRAGQLQEADRRKDEFLAMLAHELRNPLAPVRNALQVLRMKCSDDALLDRLGEMMTRQVGHLTRLVDDLLDVSRITSGKVNLKAERVNLAAAVDRAVEAVRPLVDSRGHTLTTSLPPEPIHLIADPTRLSQILGNLLNNAAKYTEAGGRIRLAVGRQGADAVITVADTGIGIPPDVLPNIFDLFTQDARGLDRAEGGLGIGLTLVRRLVEMHGGTVRAASEGPGRGSEFVVRLPVLPYDPGQDSAPPDGSDGSAAAPPRRVLIVDDNRDSAESLALLLNLGGHDVRTAGDGPAALETARAHRPDVVLLDIGLPRMDGYEVARRLRQDPGLPRMTLIAMTGYGQDEDRRRAREAGFDHHLVKPVDPEHLGRLLVDSGGAANAG